MLRYASFFFAAATAIHIDQKSAVQHAGTSVQQATKKTKPAVRRVMNMANSFAVLSRKVKQEPAAEEAAPAEGAPAEGGEEESPVDKEGYEKDWGTEFRDEPYPAAAKGKQHHPDYEQTAAEIKAELNHHFWWWCLLAVLIIAAIAFYFYKK